MRDVYLVYYYIYSPNSLFNQYLIFISYVQTKLVRFCRVINQVIRVMCCMFSVSASVRPASACGVFQHSLTSHASSIQRFCVCYTRKTICSPLSIAAQTSRRAARAVGHSRRMTDTTPLLCCACVSPCIHPRDRSSTPLLCAVFVCSKRRRPRKGDLKLDSLYVNIIIKEEYYAHSNTSSQPHPNRRIGSSSGTPFHSCCKFYISLCYIYGSVVENTLRYSVLLYLLQTLGAEVVAMERGFECQILEAPVVCYFQCLGRANSRIL